MSSQQLVDFVREQLNAVSLRALCSFAVSSKLICSLGNSCQQYLKRLLKQVNPLCSSSHDKTKDAC